ncbi:MAG: hypothetical protein ACJZ56_05040 [Candidatus Thalassarchaeaceae archaeon]
MADTGIEYLDEIGLILNILVLGFILLFLIPTPQQRNSMINGVFQLFAKLTGRTSSEKDGEGTSENADEKLPTDTVSWDRRIGAWLVVWLLVYLIQKDLSRYDLFDWMNYSGTNYDIMRTESIASWFNFIMIGSLLMLLIPIPILRKTWMVVLFAGIVLFSRIADTWALDDGFNSNYSVLLIMLCSIICVTMGIRLFLFLPDIRSKDKKDMALRRSGFFALGATVIFSDFMIFLVPGFFTGSSHTWWYMYFMNWSVVSFGFNGLVATHIITSVIMGIFSFMIIGLGLSGTYHLVLAFRKKRKFGVPGIFAVYFLLMWVMILVRFITIEMGLTDFSTMTGMPTPAGDYSWYDNNGFYNEMVVTDEMEALSVVIYGLTSGFTDNLIYPCVALMHAVKFGLIRIRTDAEKKVFQILSLALLVAIAAVFTEILQELLQIIGFFNNDIIFALICGLVLTTGWEKRLIDALEPEAETINVSWKYPQNEDLLFWIVNGIVGAAFFIQVFIGMLNPESHTELILPGILLTAAIVLINVLPGRLKHAK